MLYYHKYSLKCYNYIEEGNWIGIWCWNYVIHHQKYIFNKAILYIKLAHISLILSCYVFILYEYFILQKVAKSKRRKEGQKA